jgi:hypothetical protein
MFLFVVSVTSLPYLDDQIKKVEMGRACRPRYRWEDNVEVDLQEVGWGMD